jgi:uncharacterized alpha-E superfamily protein
MISRVADHCFWLGRYIERTESTARVLSVTRALALDGELTAQQAWAPVVIVSGQDAEFQKEHGAAAHDDGELVQRYLARDLDNPVSIACSVAAARENARSVREVIAQEVWEVINELHLWLRSSAADADWAGHRHGFYRRVRNSSQLLLGLLRSTMLHDTPLDFIWLGMLLERTGQTARLLDVHHHALTQLSTHQVVETALWLSLLRACSGFEPFMKRYQGRVANGAVASFLILERRFPRSIRYCVGSAYDRLCAIRPPARRFPRSIRYCVGSAYDRLCAIRPPADAHLPGGGAVETLHAFDAWVDALTPQDLAGAAIHDVLTHVVDEVSSVCDKIGSELLGYGRAPTADPVNQ